MKRPAFEQQKEQDSVLAINTTSTAAETPTPPAVQIIDHHESNATAGAAMPTMTTPSYLQSEVENITHIPHEGKIMVNFKDSIDRKCLKPRIFGRLSGQYLSMIH